MYILSYVVGCNCDFHKKFNRIDAIFHDFDELLERCMMEFGQAIKNEEKFTLLGINVTMSIPQKDRDDCIDALRKYGKDIRKKLKGV